MVKRRAWLGDVQLNALRYLWDAERESKFGIARTMPLMFIHSHSDAEMNAWFKLNWELGKAFDDRAVTKTYNTLPLLRRQGLVLITKWGNTVYRITGEGKARIT